VGRYGEDRGNEQGIEIRHGGGNQETQGRRMSWRLPRSGWYDNTNYSLPNQNMVPVGQPNTRAPGFLCNFPIVGGGGVQNDVRSERIGRPSVAERRSSGRHIRGDDVRSRQSVGSGPEEGEILEDQSSQRSQVSFGTLLCDRVIILFISASRLFTVLFCVLPGNSSPRSHFS
jgi:hypothetical protein